MSALNDVTRGILTKLKDLLTSTDDTIDIAVGQTTSISTVPYGYLAVQVEALLTKLNSLVGSYQAMGVAEFNALRKQRIRVGSGSGFANHGKHLVHGRNVNQGMFVGGGAQWAVNKLFLGRQDTDGFGFSRIWNPVVECNGVQHSLMHVNSRDDDIAVSFLLPPAPDGTKTYDSATGLVVTHSSSTIAFASETETNKVITSRQDYVFLESFHEKISDKGVVYPLGNVQYGASTWEGISLLNTVVAQGYSGFGEWDADTKGYGVIWSTLSEEDKVKFLQDPDNNIYSDNGELIQVRYRIRVIEGLGDEWDSVDVPSSFEGTYMEHTKNASLNRVMSQGSNTVPFDLGIISGRGFLTPNNTYSAGDIGTWSIGSNTNSHAGIFALPIALVQRRNQGAYHPSFNPEGTSMTWNASGSFPREWSHGDGKVINNTADCFDYELGGSTAERTRKVPTEEFSSSYNGSVGSVFVGRPDYKFYDAIYASDVQDLRMSSKKLPLTEIREKYKRMTNAAEVRGFEGVPFTNVYEQTNSDAVDSVGTLNLDIPSTSEVTLGDSVYSFNISNGWQKGYVTNIPTITRITCEPYDITTPWGRTQGAAMVIVEYKQTNKQANPTWADIIGDPANIAATFPNGVEGQWIPQIPDGTNPPQSLHRKSLSSGVSAGVGERTVDQGDTWISTNLTIDGTANEVTNVNSPTGSVWLLHYETQAHFTSDDVNITQLTDWSPVYATNNHKDARLTSSLIGEIATGSDPSEELSITKIVSDVVSHTPETLTPVVKYSTAIGVKEGVAYLLFNCDDTGVIDGSNIKSTALPYFIKEA
jgi:hypothetical protein